MAVVPDVADSGNDFVIDPPAVGLSHTTRLNIIDNGVVHAIYSLHKAVLVGFKLYLK